MAGAALAGAALAGAALAGAALAGAALAGAGAAGAWQAGVGGAMTVAVRVIPCLDVDAGRVVKGVNFRDLRDAGDPVELAAAYDAEGADELVFLDITASSGDRETMIDVVGRTADQVFIPLTVGGGVRSVGDVDRLLRAGADKVSLNTAAIARPELLAEAAEQSLTVRGAVRGHPPARRRGGARRSRVSPSRGRSGAGGSGGSPPGKRSGGSSPRASRVRGDHAWRAAGYRDRRGGVGGPGGGAGRR